MRRFSINKESQDEVRSLIHRLRSYRLVRNLLIGFILVNICNLLFSSLFYTPKMFRLADEKRELKLKYEILQSRIRSSQRQLNEIRHRDNYVYRPLFSSDTLSIDGVYSPYKDTKYASIEGEEFSPMVTGVWREMDQLARSLYLESKSLDELQVLSKDKEKFSTAIPAIWPIDRSKLRNKIGAFGYRNHPILRRWKFHSGVDMPGRIGDPIYATGDGVVEYVEVNRSRYGYGTQVLIDHGFGYKTRYGHLSKRHVSRGDSVTRGQVIGDVGNTGVSLGSHLHYEVRYNDIRIDPIHYFFMELSPDEYQRIIRIAQSGMQSFD